MVFEAATAAVGTIGAVPEIVSVAKPIITKARVIIAGSILAVTGLGIYLWKRPSKAAPAVVPPATPEAEAPQANG